MNFRQLSTFVGIYEEGSFNKAAQRLNATQSGLSMQIRNLEDSLGCSLFDRTAKGVTPTVAGTRLYATAVDILRQLDGAEAELRNLSGMISGRLRPATAKSLVFLTRVPAQTPMASVPSR